MTAARCRLSFIDSDGLDHAAHVQAESVYEAVAMAVAEFREDPPVPNVPGVPRHHHELVLEVDRAMTVIEADRGFICRDCP